jgi:type II secretory pathway component PulK
MKTPLQSNQSQRGTAVIVMLAILSLMFIYIAANVRSLGTLEREIKLLDQKQIRRLERISATNNVTVLKVNPTAADSK